MIWQRGFTNYCTELPNMKELCYRMKIKMICCCLNEAVISITTNCKLNHFLCVVLGNIHTLPIHVCSKLTKLEFTRGGRRTEVGSNQSTSLGREGEHICCSQSNQDQESHTANHISKFQVCRQPQNWLQCQSFSLYKNNLHLAFSHTCMHMNI